MLNFIMANGCVSVPSYFFTTLASISSKKSSYLTHRPAVRVHGNTGKRPKHHLTLSQIKDDVQFILNYTGMKTVRVHVQVRVQITYNYALTITCMSCLLTESNAMVLRGRIPGYKRSDIQLLPSSTTKHKIWDLYQQAAA